MSWFDILKTKDPFFMAIDEMVSFWESLHDWYEHIWNQIGRMKNDPVYSGEMQNLVSPRHTMSVQMRKTKAQEHIDTLTQFRDANSFGDFYYYLKRFDKDRNLMKDVLDMIYNILKKEKPAGVRGWFTNLNIPKPPEIPTSENIAQHTQRLEEFFLHHIPGKKEGEGRWVQRR